MKKIILTLSIVHFSFYFSYAQTGSLDNTFGTGGIVTTPVDSSIYAEATAKSVVLQSDGKIVAAGFRTWYYGTGDVDFVVTRYNSNGTLDNTFGTGGIIITNVNPPSNSDDYANSVAIQADGKIVVAGSTDVDFALVRYNTNGSLDNTFGIGGIVITDFGGFYGDYGQSVAIQNDGKIIVAGGNDDFILARYNSDGSLDNTFGTGGKVSTDFVHKSDHAESIAILSDGKIIVSGYNTNASVTGEAFALARYNADGSLDNTFGNGGKVSTVIVDSVNQGAEAVSINIQSDGKIVAAGYVWPGDYTTSNVYSFALARYNSNGTLDNTFDADGIVTTSIGSTGAVGNSAIIQSDGKIIMAGYADVGFALARYNTNGSLDNTFGTGGIVSTDIRSGQDQCFSVAKQSDGKIVAAGVSQNDVYSENDFAIVRYNNAAPLGIAESVTNNGSELKIYPNPASGTFTISMDNCKNAKICVYDVLGNCLMSKVCENEANPEIDLTGEVKGVYLMEVIIDGAKVVKKIVLQ